MDCDCVSLSKTVISKLEEKHSFYLMCWLTFTGFFTLYFDNLGKLFVSQRIQM